MGHTPRQAQVVWWSLMIISWNQSGASMLILPRSIHSPWNFQLAPIGPAKGDSYWKSPLFVGNMLVLRSAYNLCSCYSRYLPETKSRGCRFRQQIRYLPFAGSKYWWNPAALAGWWKGPNLHPLKFLKMGDVFFCWPSWCEREGARELWTERFRGVD